MRRILTFLTILAYLGSSTGCTSTHRIAAEREISKSGSDIHERSGQRISGYTRTDGVHREFRGYVRAVPGDTLEFLRLLRKRSWGKTEVVLGGAFVLPRDSVQTLFIERTDALKTVAVIGISALVFGAVVAIATIASKESCPFIYSYDGERYVFDGEPYGGATMKGLERTDWSELEHLVERGGRYRLLLTNEVDETQHTNSLDLLVVDHLRGTRIVLDRDGGVHALARTASLRSAVDEDGNDLTSWLRATDRLIWDPDLRAFAERATLPDARNHITIEFDRPRGAERVYLISHVATGQWGSHMIRSMLSMHGNRVGSFYEAVNTNEGTREELLQWNRREELFDLAVELRCGERWEVRGWVPGAGPFLSESRALPIDLVGVVGDRVQFRIHPPIGFWSLNSFQLGWKEADHRVIRVAPRKARNALGTDVLPALSEIDDRYVDFPEVGDRVELEFDAPPRVPGRARTVFARTRGWYEIHLHNLGEPDTTRLAGMQNEPGFAVREAMREFAEFRRTGVLAGVRAGPGTRARE